MSAGARARIRSLLRRPAHLLAATAFLPLAALLALCLRPAAALRRARRTRPRVVWSPTPIISTSYWSAAIRALGYESRTLVRQVYHINAREDFDLLFADLRVGALAPYAAFLWSLFHADVYSLFYDGGYLATTPLARVEPLLLRLAGKRIVASPYGRDIAVPEYLGVARDGVLASSAEIAAAGPRTKAMVDSTLRHAHLAVRNLQFGYLPRADVWWPNQVAIDVEAWRPASPDAEAGEVVVLHSSNHRAIKGTDRLVATVEALRAEGVPVRLDLYEGRPNTEVRAGLERCDVLADQFVSGYGLAAIEGLAMGKPVLSTLPELDPAYVAGSCLEDCPIVDTSLDELHAALRQLVLDGERRRAIGERSRRYAVRYHSYAAAAETWDGIFRHVWLGDPLELGTAVVEPVAPRRGGRRGPAGQAP